ncbi:MAG: XdhC family protein, partial [Burkholderiaceae bacterium]
MQRFDWIDEAQRLSRAQQPFALVTVLRTQPPTSAKAGDKAVVTADGRIHGWIGGGCAQPTVIKTVRDALADGQPRNIRISPATETTTQQLNDVLEFGMACHSGGTLELFIEPMVPAAQLTIIGDSAVAKALAQLAPRVGLQVTVIAQDTTATAFPDATRVLTSDDPASLAALV